MSWEHYESGRTGGTAGRSTQSWQNGHNDRLAEEAERERARTEALRRAMDSGRGHRVSTPDWSSGSGAPSGPSTLKGAAQGGAILFSVVFALYALASLQHLAWLDLAVRGAGAALAGAVAGAALYIVLTIVGFVLSIALKVVGFLLLAAIVLHFTGLVSFGAFVGHLRGMTGL